ncbi:YebB family permuted papain-like enzyme [Variovorax sp. J22R133]|uniref:YebB family permuted papain-like enzyme n=1 Tax=Variovorax brevis TaxID=3053503 RepID=UPI002578DA31|nr:YebB family permuted papain-like enzyme [Variovorax sp. J22R133]MDM0114989.1 YebB family permuted papain-like enzyme [Variovorax sp. J22R133]
MSTFRQTLCRWTGVLWATALLVPLGAQAANAASATTATIASLASDLQVGDVVFIRIGAKPFREVADATDSWTNHVGVVVDTQGAEPLIGESAVPWSGTTTLSKFVARSEGGRVAVMRLHTALTPAMQQKVAEAAGRRSGIHYDTGFNLHSRGQFCSRYVREVLMEATGKTVGEVETFAHLLSRKPDANLGFWKLWYFGRIPWDRETVTPASLLNSPELRPVFDGVATASP